MVDQSSFWKGRKVLITGHTGFKGGWLSLWLKYRGALVSGYSLLPNTRPNFYEACGLTPLLEQSVYGDIADLPGLRSVMGSASPEVVFHLAAQPIVRASYEQPVDTFATNVMGTVNLLEAVRHTPTVRAVVVVTTDKCYENKEWLWPYRENDKLGGHDPYSSSKACAEIATDAYRKSFFANGDVAVATARAGNVIGGGDWSKDRLVPDFFRAIAASKELVVRSPQAVRPWQHVLEPLFGYMLLAERLFEGGQRYATSWNFGPNECDSITVEALLDELCSATGAGTYRVEKAVGVHEANTLRLDSSQAKSVLGWKPKFRLKQAIEKTVEWYIGYDKGENMEKLSLSQIAFFEGYGKRL